ncbi:MAG: tetratricopeptide repeat protein [bacterium]
MDSEIDELLGRLDAHPGSLIFARLADLYLRADKMDQAIEVCEQGLSHHSDYVSGHVVMAKCYSKIGLVDQAKAEYHRALELDGEHLTALFHLGDIYYEEKKFDLALHSYRRVLQLDPYNESAKKRIGHLKGYGAVKTTEFNGSLEPADAKEAQEDSIATATLAEIYASQGLTDRAINVLRRLLERNPNSEEVRNRIKELEKRLQMTQAGGDHGHDG